MAQIANNHALTVTDGLNDYVNIDTVNKVIQLVNGCKLALYSDNYVTQGLTMTASGTNPVVSATSPAIANAATITTSGVGIARVTPAAARTGIILQAGTVAGQACWVINEATSAASSITFDVSGTSGVADGISNVIYGNQARHFSWDASTSLWVASSPLVLGTIATVASASAVSLSSSGTIATVASASAVSLSSSGTIATAGLGMSRVTTSGNVTGIILAAGVIVGQEVIVSNESANTITFAASGSNVADGNTSAIPANCARKLVWNGSNWYRLA